MSNLAFPSTPERDQAPPPHAAGPKTGMARTIGEIIRSAKKLPDSDINRVLAFQTQHGLRFGEAAIQLRIATQEEVLWALSQQFHYPYSERSAEDISPEVFVATQPFSDEAEVFRDLRSQLLPLMANRPVRPALAVTSANIGDGKSFFASNLAVSLSQLGGRTLLIDADMRTPRQHKIFNTQSANGLSSILSGRIDPDVIQPIKDIPSLYLMPVGVVPPNPLELLHRPAFDILLKELSQKFDQIIVDTPAAEHGADSKVIACICGLALTIGRRARSSLTDMDRLIERLHKGHCELAGVVMNEH